MDLDLSAKETGPREFIVAMLEERADVEYQRGIDRLATSARAAARLIRDGRPFVWVGATKYVVVSQPSTRR
jgi:hypothetical protein